MILSMNQKTQNKQDLILSYEGMTTLGYHQNYESRCAGFSDFLQTMTQHRLRTSSWCKQIVLEMHMQSRDDSLLNDSWTPTLNASKD